MTAHSIHMTNFPKVLKRLCKKFWPIGLIFFLTAIFFWKFFILKQIPIPGDFVIGTYFPWLDYKWGYSVGVPVKNPITTDVVSFTYPMRIAAVEMLKNKTLPLWNPYILTGIPLLSNFQSAPFSITIPYYFITDNLNAWSLQVITQHILDCIFMYLLLRYLKLSKTASVFGGTVYAFSGFNMIWSQWNAHALAASFLPLITLITDKYFVVSSKIVFLIPAIILIQIMSGYPQILIYTAVIVFLVWLINFKKNIDYFFKTFVISILYIFGFALASFQLFPSWELLQNSQRAIEPLEFSSAFLPWQKIITFIAPDYFGNHVTNNYWGLTDYTTTTGYVGVVALVLSIYALKYIKKEKIVVLGSVLSITSLIISLPTFISIYLWKSGIFGMQAASAHRGLIIFTFGVSMLSAFGYDRFVKTNRFVLSSLYKPIIIVGLLLCFYALYALTNSYYPSLLSYFNLQIIDKWKSDVAIRNLFLPYMIYILFYLCVLVRKINYFPKIVFSISIFILMVFELFRFGWKFTPFTKKQLIYPTTPVIEFLKNNNEPIRTISTEVIPINMKMAYGIESFEGYDAIYPVNIAKYVAVSNSNNITATPQGRYASAVNYLSPLLDIANVKYLIALKKNDMGKPDQAGKIPSYLNNKYKEVFNDKTTSVLENKNYMPRAAMYYFWDTIFDDNLLLSKLVNKDFDYKNTLIINEYIGKPEITSDARNTVEYLMYRSDKSRIKITSTNDGLLFVSDLYYPGWKAYVDGKEVIILKANYAFRAVSVSQGSHVIEFVYKPDSFYTGVKISIISFLLLLLYTYLINRKYGNENSRRTS